MAGLWGVYGQVLGRFVRRIVERVSPDKYSTEQTGANRFVTSRSSAHSCDGVDHNCTFVRLCAQAREDVQAWVTGTIRTRTHST